MNEERIGYSSGWSVEDDPAGGFRWAAHGPAGILRGQAPTRAEAEQAAQEAERELAPEPGVPGTPRVRRPAPSRQRAEATASDRESGPPSRRIERLLDLATAWARQQPGICGLALVGSWARGSARADSDVDLVVLTTHPNRHLSHDWIAALGATRVVRTQAWGPLTERRLLLEDGLELDIGIAGPAWAATDPIDPGTRRVATDGLRILHDPDRRLAALAVVASQP